MASAKNSQTPQKTVKISGSCSSVWIQSCKLCQQPCEREKKSVSCCKRCSSVKVRLKDIKPLLGEIKTMLAKHRQLKQMQKLQSDKAIVTDLQVEDAFAMPTADPEDGRSIPLSPSCHMRINVACSYYPHDVHTVSPQLLAKYFSVELSILFKLSTSDTVVCTVCAAKFYTDGKTVSQSILECHVSQVHVPNSTARDYRFVCTACDAPVYDLLGVRKHMKEKHPDLMSLEESGDISMYKCTICKDLNKGKSRLIMNKAVQFGSKLALQIHMTEVHPGNLVCFECKNTTVFTTQDMLELHTNAYHPEVG